MRCMDNLLVFNDLNGHGLYEASCHLHLPPAGVGRGRGFPALDCLDKLNRPSEAQSAILHGKRKENRDLVSVLAARTSYALLALAKKHVQLVSMQNPTKIVSNC